MIAVEDQEKDHVLEIILQTARTGDTGTFGDGKIFIHRIEQAYTISSGLSGL